MKPLGEQFSAFWYSQPSLNTEFDLKSRVPHTVVNKYSIYTTMCKIDSWWEAQQELSSVLCDDLEGCE